MDAQPDCQLNPPKVRETYFALRPETIEKTFTDCVMDLQEVIVLDGIEMLADNSGFRVRSHDQYWPLPEIALENSGDTLQDKDRLGHETGKLVAIVRLRNQMVQWANGGRFLSPTRIDDHVVVGLKVGSETFLVDGPDFLAAYHSLQEKVVG